jgi:WD40 repeat protein
MLGFGKKALVLNPAWQVEMEESVTAVAWAVREGRLAAMPVEGKILVLDGRSGKTLHTLPGHKMGNNSMVWSHDGGTLFTAGQDGKVNAYKAQTGELLYSISPGGKWIDHLAWSPAFRSFAVSDGKLVKIYKEAGTISVESPAHESAVSGIAWSPDGKLLATGCYGGVRIWDPQAAKCIQTMEAADKVTFIVWSPSARFVAAGLQAETLFVGRRDSDDHLQMSGYPSRTRSLSWTHDSQLLATTGGKATIIWNFGGNGPEGSRPKMLEKHEDNVTQVAFGGAKLATACEAGIVNVWDVKTWGQMFTGNLGAHVHAMAWRPDNQMLVTGDGSGRLTAFAV